MYLVYVLQLIVLHAITLARADGFEKTRRHTGSCQWHAVEEMEAHTGLQDYGQGHCSNIQYFSRSGETQNPRVHQFGTKREAGELHGDC